jgi:hypothetical protein
MPRKKQPGVMLRKTRDGRYGAIRGATGTRYHPDNKGQITVAPEDVTSIMAQGGWVIVVNDEPSEPSETLETSD